MSYTMDEAQLRRSLSRNIRMVANTPKPNRTTSSQRRSGSRGHRPPPPLHFPLSLIQHPRIAKNPITCYIVYIKLQWMRSSAIPILQTPSLTYSTP